MRWDPATGRVTGTLTVSLENTAPAEGWPDYVIGNGVGLRGHQPVVRVDLQPVPARGGACWRWAGGPAGGDRGRAQRVLDLRRHPSGGTVEIELDLSGTIEGRRYQLDVPVQPFATVDTLDVAVEVVGVTPVVSGEATVAGNVAEWSVTLDRNRSLSVTVRGADRRN